MRNSLRALAATAAAAGLVLLAGPASAHVTVDPSQAQQGGYTTLTFRVPTESDTLSTTSVAVQLPTDEPFASVSVKPHPGWTYRVARARLAQPIAGEEGQITEAVSTITWTAEQGAGIEPGEFDEFEVSVGPLPTEDSLTFKTVQTYSDGSVVRWIDEAEEGQPEPEHPAPVLTLTAASDDAASSSAGDGGTTATEDAGGDSDSGSDSASDSDSDDSKAPLVLSIIALVVAVAGAGVAVVRRRG